MRLFKSSHNKSQASIEDRLSASRDPSPTQGAGFPDSQHYFDHQPYSHQQQQQQQPLPQPAPLLIETQYQGAPAQSQVEPPPVQRLSRSQSGRIPSSGDLYPSHATNPNNLPALSQQQIVVPEGPAPVPGQTTFGQSRQVRTIVDKEPKRSKLSFITGLVKDKGRDEEKEREKEKENAHPERKGLGRSSSVHLLRKSHPLDHASREASSTQTSPHYQTRHSAYYPPPPTDTSAPGQIHPTADQPQYESYHRPQGQFDSPQSQLTHQSLEYAEDTPHFSPQDQYQAYRQSESASTSEHYLPYQPQPHRPSNVESDPYQHLRPPSQASLGPPSPIANPPHSVLLPDSRPSTAATNRYSTQSTNQGPAQPLGVMARGDPTNGSHRQQLPQREPRPEEHTQYQSQQDPRVRMSQQVSEQGRSTPPPRSREDISQLDYHQLLQRHEELQAKYSKVKRYYFEREAQVTQLQNTVASQRLSMSKTSLDDAQYTARFERLSQAINNLSFNIRKNWRAIPPWLRHVCNQDAHTVGTKEMTAVGRACITRWLFESIFERTFHPGIDPGLSAQLKNIERHLRRAGQTGMLLSDEQRDDLTTKITTWRLTTIEGLQDVLSSPQAEQYSENLNKHFTHQLTESLKANLTDPPPMGLSEGVSMIVGQAIGIASNLPLESRDICIDYFMPGTPVNETYMKLEPQITPLANPGPDERLLAMQAAHAQAQAMQEAQEGDGMSTASTDDGPRERDVEADIREAAGKAASQSAQQASSGAAGGLGGRNDSVASAGSQATIKNSNDKQLKKPSFLGGFVSKKPQQGARGENRGEGAGNNGEEQRGNVRESMAVDAAQLIPPPGANEGRIRFAAFLAVEVRGKGPSAVPSSGSGNSGKEPGSAAAGGVSPAAVNVLFKAPVYEY